MKALLKRYFLLAAVHDIKMGKRGPVSPSGEIKGRAVVKLTGIAFIPGLLASSEPPLLKRAGDTLPGRYNSLLTGWFPVLIAGDCHR